MDAAETGRRVRMARNYAGLSQYELADKIEMSRGTLLKIENGKREAKRGELWEISEACGVPMWVLENPWHEYPMRQPERRNPPENNETPVASGESEGAGGSSLR